MSPIDAENLPTLEESLSHIRGNYNELFPTADGRRKTLGNIPTGLHTDILALAEERNLRMFEIIAGLMDFYHEYESHFSAELTYKRKNTPAIRR